MKNWFLSILLIEYEGLCFGIAPFQKMLALFWHCPLPYGQCSNRAGIFWNGAFLSVPFTFAGSKLTVDVKCDQNAVRSFGPTEYKVTIEKAKGGRLNGRGRKDPLGVDYHFSCTCWSYKDSLVCKHIACLCISHFNWFVHCDHFVCELLIIVN